MSKRPPPPPPSRFVSSASTGDDVRIDDDEVLHFSPSPPTTSDALGVDPRPSAPFRAHDVPPPPPPAAHPTARHPPSSAEPASRHQRSSPPSVLRSNNRGTSKNSVAFSNVMDVMQSNPVPDVSPLSQQQQNVARTSAAMPASAAVAAAAEAATSLSSLHKLAASFSSTKNLNNNQTFSLEAVVNSQFESEAETHILAALEMDEAEKENQSRLLGEGIEGMEDYSDDEDDDKVGGQVRSRTRSESNDSFMRKVAMQNELPQYQAWSGYSDKTDSSPTSEANAWGNKSSPPRGGVQQQQQQQQQQQPQQQQQQHKRFASTTIGSAGYLPSVPDDAALMYSESTGVPAAATAVNETIAMHIESDHLEGGDDPFLDAAKSHASSKRPDPFGEGGIDGEAQEQHPNNNDSGQQPDSSDGEVDDATTTQAAQTVNTRTDTTENTGNMNFMADRLRSLQKRRHSRNLGSSSGSRRRSFLESTGHDDEPEGGGGESSGDRLIDALNSVDSSKDTSFLKRMRREYHELIVPKLPTFYANISHILLVLVLPSLSVAALLFYMLDNPMAGESETSWSWWILFLGVRQPLMFELTRVGEVFWVEILALRSRLFNMAVGPYISLAFIQSKGWPYILTFWAVFDFIFLYGSHKFPRHWLFWQNKLDLFNEANPVSGVVDNRHYMRALGAAVFVGVSASLKRLFLAIFLERRAVKHYGSELEKLMAKMILIGEVANLARDIENKRSIFEGALSPVDETFDAEKLVRFRDLMVEEGSSVEASPSPHLTGRKVLELPPTPSPQATQRKVQDGPTPNLGGGSSPKISPGTSVSQGAGARRDSDGNTPPRHRSPHSPGDGASTTAADNNVKKSVTTSSTANVKLMYLLSEWEEPELISGKNSKATVADLVQFRKAVSTMDDKYPFSRAFGHANTRELCVQASQQVYDRLMLSAPSDSPALPFSILSVLAMDEKGEFVDAKIKSHIRLFRPDREGGLSKLDFVKCVDTVYKELRLLRASIANSAQIDLAFERIINCFFYFFVVIIAFTIFGFNNIWTVFLSFNTFFLGFSFLFGSAASKYFEGLLLIFVRRPYGIGDRIATSNPKSDTNPDGSSTWFVDKVSLFTTTVRFATTNEVATYSNGSLAVLRIINANRSPKAIVTVMIKFGLETPFNKITVFRTAVENFIKARPREWIALVGFRATRVEADFGYVEYKIITQHRESWQNVGPILQSKADLSAFCLEATKKLGMKYESPPMPVNLSASGDDGADFGGIFQREDDGTRGGDVRKSLKSFSAEDLQEVANLFEIRKKKK